METCTIRTALKSTGLPPEMQHLIHSYLPRLREHLLYSHDVYHTLKRVLKHVNFSIECHALHLPEEMQHLGKKLIEVHVNADGSKTMWCSGGHFNLAIFQSILNSKTTQTLASIKNNLRPWPEAPTDHAVLVVRPRTPTSIPSKPIDDLFKCKTIKLTVHVQNTPHLQALFENLMNNLLSFLVNMPEASGMTVFLEASNVQVDLDDATSTVSWPQVAGAPHPRISTAALAKICNLPSLEELSVSVFDPTHGKNMCRYTRGVPSSHSAVNCYFTEVNAGIVARLQHALQAFHHYSSNDVSEIRINVLGPRNSDKTPAELAALVLQLALAAGRTYLRANIVVAVRFKEIYVDDYELDVAPGLHREVPVWLKKDAEGVIHVPVHRNLWTADNSPCMHFFNDAVGVLDNNWQFTETAAAAASESSGGRKSRTSCSPSRTSRRKSRTSRRKSRTLRRKSQTPRRQSRTPRRKSKVRSRAAFDH